MKNENKMKNKNKIKSDQIRVGNDNTTKIQMNLVHGHFS
jgi:hypothetical protein